MPVQYTFLVRRPRLLGFYITTGFSSAFAKNTLLPRDSHGEVALLGPPRLDNRSQAVTDRCLCYERWQLMLMLFGGLISEALSTGNPTQRVFFAFVLFFLSKCVFLFVVVFIILFLLLVCWHSHCHHSTGYGECLLDEPAGRTYELPTLLPGQIYNANRQCELMFGPGSQLCPYMVGPPTDILVESWDCWLIWTLTGLSIYKWMGISSDYRVRTANIDFYFKCYVDIITLGLFHLNFSYSDHSKQDKAF